MSEHLEVYCDGSGKGGYCCVIKRSDGRLYPHQGFEEGITVDVAEFKAILLAVNMLPRRSKATIYSDRLSVINQIKLEWHISNALQRNIAQQILYLVNVKKLDVEFKHISRDDNLAGKFLG
jgi:ribonuclease HI